MESSRGRYHAYVAVDDVPLEEFSTIQKHLAKLYGGDPAVHDLPRVMRLPGFYHGKSETPFLTKVIGGNPEASYSRADLLGAFDGLQDALEQAANAEAARLEQAAQSSARAQQKQEELRDGDITDQNTVELKYAQIALMNEVAELASTGQGERNAQLYKSAAALGNFIGANVLDEDSVRAELESTALAVGLGSHEIKATLESGLTAGKKKPRDLSNVAQLVGKKKGQGNDKGKKPKASQSVRSSRADSSEEKSDSSDQQGDGSDRLVIEMDPDNFITAQAILTALLSTNDPLETFKNNDGLVRLEFGSAGPIIKPMGAKELIAHVQSRISFFEIKYDKQGNELVVPGNLQKGLVDLLLGLELNHFAKFPFLDSIIRTPIYNPQGTLETAEGYCIGLGVWLELGGRAVPTVPEIPTDDDLAEAKSLILDEFLADFPFIDQASKAHALCLGLQPLARELIKGNTPLYGITAPTRVVLP